MAQFVAQHREAPVPQGGTGKVLREFLQFQPPQFLGQPDPDAARAWLDAVERTFRSMECVPEERVLLVSYQLQAQALTWWSSEWETTFQSRSLRQIPWQEFVVSFERAFCPTYVRTKRLYQFLDLQQRDLTVVQYRARFVELGCYALQIMADEGLRTQQFVRGLRPELRQTLIVARVTDLDAAYQTAAALEADTLQTRARSAEVQTQVVPSQPRQQQGSVQTTPRTATSYASTSNGTTARSGSRRKFRRDRRQAEQRQQSLKCEQFRIRVRIVTQNKGSAAADLLLLRWPCNDKKAEARGLFKGDFPVSYFEDDVARCRHGPTANGASTHGPTVAPGAAPAAAPVVGDDAPAAVAVSPASGAFADVEPAAVVDPAAAASAPTPAGAGACRALAAAPAGAVLGPAALAPDDAQQPTSADEIRSLWIGDLQYWMDETYLHSCFASSGEVQSHVDQIMDPDCLGVLALLGMAFWPFFFSGSWIQIARPEINHFGSTPTRPEMKYFGLKL
ncbi:hypothetical protein Taro_014524 [Colocasia esculenta]|uniref:Retrotransposon gag domain-containing protein n=1 Tax=Colocasia esculenta TaxID=4460 RepID=A0A843UJN9_COLES|nr:hypothetical protein [Colocasia esculenta]